MCQNMILSFKIITLFSGQLPCNPVAPISAEIHSLLYQFIVIILNKYMGFKPQTIKINTHIQQLYSYIYISISIYISRTDMHTIMLMRITVQLCTAYQAPDMHNTFHTTHRWVK